MNLRPEPKSAGNKPAHLARQGETSRPGKPSPTRKLFQPEAKPLESGVTPLLAVRRPRRSTRPLAVLVACVALAGTCLAQEANPVPDPLLATNTALEETVEHRADMLAEQIVQTNDAGPTNISGETNSIPTPNVVAAERRYSTRNGDNNTSRRTSSDRDWRRDRKDSDSRRSYSGSRSGSSSNTASASPQRPGKAVESFSAFALIGDRNIFNPNRSPRRSNNTEQRPKPVVVDSFGLVGIMAYEKGTFVFFDGSRSEFKKVLKLSDTIAGYTIAEVGSGSVKLSKNGQTLELPVGAQMRREEQGDWTLSKQPQTYAASPSPGPASTSTSTSAPSGPPGAADDVLKRLMQRREQE